MNRQLAIGAVGMVLRQLLGVALGMGAIFGLGTGLLGLLLTPQEVYTASWVALAVCGVALWQLSKARGRRVQAMLEDANRQHSTHFRVDPKLCFGNAAISLYFDPDKRQVLIASFDGASIKVRDFSYIRGWELTWIEHSRHDSVQFRNVRMRIQTSDLAVPEFSVPMPNITAGREWNQRLAILLR